MAGGGVWAVTPQGTGVQELNRVKFAGPSAHGVLRISVFIPHSSFLIPSSLFLSFLGCFSLGSLILRRDPGPNHRRVNVWNDPLDPFLTSLFLGHFSDPLFSSKNHPKVPKCPPDPSFWDGFWTTFGTKSRTSGKVLDQALARAGA